MTNVPPPVYKLLRFNCAQFVHLACKGFVKSWAGYNILNVADALERGEDPIQYYPRFQELAKRLLTFATQNVPIPRYVFPSRSENMPTLATLKRLVTTLPYCTLVTYDAILDEACTVYVVSVERGSIRHIGFLLLDEVGRQYTTIGQGFMHYGVTGYLGSSLPDWTGCTPRIAKITSPDRDLDIYSTIGILNPTLKVHVVLTPTSGGACVSSNIRERITVYCNEVEERVSLAQSVLMSMLPFEASVDDIQTSLSQMNRHEMQSIVARMFCCFTTGTDCSAENFVTYYEETKVEPLVYTIQQLTIFATASSCIAQITALDAIMRSREIVNIC